MENLVFNGTWVIIVKSTKWDGSFDLDAITLCGLTHSGCTRLECLCARKVEEEAVLEGQEESSREEDAEEEEEEMVRDMVLVFFCTLWTLQGHISAVIMFLFFIVFCVSVCVCVCVVHLTYFAMVQVLQEAVTDVIKLPTKTIANCQTFYTLSCHISLSHSHKLVCIVFH